MDRCEFQKQPALTSALLILDTFKRKHLTNAAPLQQQVTFRDIVAKKKKRKRKNKLDLKFNKNVSKIIKGDVSCMPGINIWLNIVCRHVAWHTKYTFSWKRNYDTSLYKLTMNLSIITNIPVFAASTVCGVSVDNFWRACSPSVFSGELLCRDCCWSSSSATNEITPKTNRYQVLY